MLKKTLLFALGLITMVGSYVLPLKAQTPNNYEVRKIAVVDRNNDQQPDIVFVGREKSAHRSDTKLMYLENQGNSQFSEQKVFEQQLKEPYNLFKGKVTNDELEDLIVIEEGSGSNNGGIYFLPNENGRFGKPIPLPAHLQNQDIWAGAMADVNGDGREDLIGIQNDDNMFTVPSTILWAESLAEPQDYRGTGETHDYRGMGVNFGLWKKLDVNTDKYSSDYEIVVFDENKDSFPDLRTLVLNISRQEKPAKLRAINMAKGTGYLQFETPQMKSMSKSEKFGFLDDLDFEHIRKDRKGEFRVYRLGLKEDGTSVSDAIYLITENKNVSKIHNN